MNFKLTVLADQDSDGYTDTEEFLNRLARCDI